jgi:hypothetical protein
MVPAACAEIIMICLAATSQNGHSEWSVKPSIATEDITYYGALLPQSVENDVIQADFGNGALQLILSKLNRSKEKP